MANRNTVGAAEAAVVVTLRQGDRSFAPLALNEGFGGLPLRIQRAESLLQSLWRRPAAGAIVEGQFSLRLPR
jgi:hypothetical protein